jgi:formylglycine-generating enzyme required for sulfatase activity
LRQPAKGEDKTPAATASAVAPPASASAAPIATCPDGMVKIPAGQYFMGSDQRDAKDDQKPTHNVKLDSFCMDLYEVTAGKYKSCSDVGKCRRAPTEVEWPNISDDDRKLYSPLCTAEKTDQADHPITCVSWQMADTYCKAQGKRLPTEAEWEYAARGPDGRIYPWGDDAPTVGHLNACDKDCALWARKAKVGVSVLFAKESDGYASTAPVGSFPAGRSRFGLDDVVGNVWEWVSDRFGPYSAEAQKNPTGPSEGAERVIRGGGWNGGQEPWLRPAFRHASNPEVRSPALGFRCAKSR